MSIYMHADRRRRTHTHPHIVRDYGRQKCRHLLMLTESGARHSNRRYLLNDPFLSRKIDWAPSDSLTLYMCELTISKDLLTETLY